MPDATIAGHETPTQPTEAFRFGPCVYDTPELEAFWTQHATVMEAWVGAMQAQGDPWWQSAAHAACCLVSHREFEAQALCEGPHWRSFDVERFLFFDLHEGGTVSFFGSVPIFFSQLVEALERFARAGIIDAQSGELWLAQLSACEKRFIDHYERGEPEVAIRPVVGREHPTVAPRPTSVRAPAEARTEKCPTTAQGPAKCT